jgi:hypothetical protein
MINTVAFFDAVKSASAVDSAGVPFGNFVRNVSGTRFSANPPAVVV